MGNRPNNKKRQSTRGRSTTPPPVTAASSSGTPSSPIGTTTPSTATSSSSSAATTSSSTPASTMLTFHVTPPDLFTFSTPSELPNWIARFERFMSASGLIGKSEVEQVNALIYLMGPQAEEILKTFALKPDELKVFQTVRDKFHGHFVVRQNVIYDRYKFNCRVQQEGEPVDEFITSLHTLADKCQYKDLREEMIRDRIVVGVRDGRLSEQLQMDNALTLDTAVQKARQSEAVKRQVKDLRKEAEDKKFEQVTQKRDRKPQKDCSSSKPPNKRGSGSHQSKSSGKSTDQAPQPDKCKWCAGKTPHIFAECPAQGKQCTNCKLMNHYAAACRKPTQTNSVTVEEREPSSETTKFLGSITTLTARRRRWTETITVGGKPVKFRLDSGADVTTIPLQLFNELFRSSHKLSSSTDTLSGPNSSKLETVGTFQSQLKFNGNTLTRQVYVVKGLQQSLLGLEELEDLKIAKRIQPVENSSTTIHPKSEFPQLFRGLGIINTPYNIQLVDNAEPFAFHVARRVPLPLMSQLQQQLDEMVALGVIQPVDQPTDWCAILVITAKSNGQLRLCVDLTRLNKFVKRERYPMPSVEHTLGQLAGAKYFSKLDANSGFWQIPLTEESKHLTTFITPFGRYCHL